MKIKAIATAIITANVALTGAAHATGFHQYIDASHVKVGGYWGTQDRVNSHVDSNAKRLEDRIDHLQRSDTNHNAWTGRQQVQIDENTKRLDGHDEHLGRIEGALGAQRIADRDRDRRITENKEGLEAANQQLDSNTGRLGSVEQAAQTANDRATALEGRADRTETELAGTTERSIGNQKAIGDIQKHQGVQDDRIQGNTNRIDVVDQRSQQTVTTVAGIQTSLQKTRDTVGVQGQHINKLKDRADVADADRAAISSRVTTVEGNVQRNTGHIGELKNRADAAAADRQNLYAVVSTVDSDSRNRDANLQGQLNQQGQSITDIQQNVYNNTQWSIEQFGRHADAINELSAAQAQNAQAIANEREERKQQGREANAGIASAAAIGQHHFDTNYRGFQLSVSAAGYRGEHAQSLSAGGALTDSVFGSVAVSHDSRGHQTYGVQSTFKF